MEARLSAKPSRAIRLSKMNLPQDFQNIPAAKVTPPALRRGWGLFKKGKEKRKFCFREPAWSLRAAPRHGIKCHPALCSVYSAAVTRAASTSASRLVSV